MIPADRISTLPRARRANAIPTTDRHGRPIPVDNATRTILLRQLWAGHDPDGSTRS